MLVIGSGQSHAAIYAYETAIGRICDVEGQFKDFPGYATLTVKMPVTDANLVFTSKIAGATGQTYTVQYIDPGVDGAESAVLSGGVHIQLTLGRSGGNIISTAASAKATMLAVSGIANLVTITFDALTPSGSGLLSAFASKILSNGKIGTSIQTKYIVPEGRIPIWHITATKSPGSYSLADTTNLDPVYSQMFQDILAASSPYSPYVRCHLEMNQLNGSHYLGTANQYIAWYRHVVGLYPAALAAYRLANPGNTQVIYFVWNSTSVGGFDPTSPNYAVPFYPGDDVVDFIGCDTYERTQGQASLGPWTDASVRLEPMRVWATTNSRGGSPSSTPAVTDGTKLGFVGELGCAENLNHPGGTGPQDKATWWDNLGTYLNVNASFWACIMFTSTPLSNDHPDFRVNSSNASYTHWQTLVESAPFGSGPAPPGPPTTLFNVIVQSGPAKFLVLQQSSS